MGIKHGLRALALVGGIPLISAAGDMTVRGAPFAEPTQCTSRDCVLELDAVDYQGPDSSFKTRMYNGAIPGPTIRVQAGDTFHITVHNHLLDIDNFDFEELNIFKHPNSAGLHTRMAFTQPI